MKHPKRQANVKFNGGTGQDVALLNGTVTSMVGKGTFSLTFNIDVAAALGFDHKETLRYEVSDDRLIIKKGST
jgi:hypothetical protein